MGEEEEDEVEEEEGGVEEEKEGVGEGEERHLARDVESVSGCQKEGEVRQPRP